MKRWLESHLPEWVLTAHRTWAAFCARWWKGLAAALLNLAALIFLLVRLVLDGPTWLVCAAVFVAVYEARQHP